MMDSRPTETHRKRDPEKSTKQRVTERLDSIVEDLVDPDECEAHEFRQAMQEVEEALRPEFESNPELLNQFQLLCESERIIIFRVVWEDDHGRIRLNKGYRVQHSSALGPFKGGLRFHPSVNLSICRFLAFEQTFKNALTGLPMGGAKGGANIDPKTMSAAEMRRFCQAFMMELYHYIGPELDIPAGDIGVSSREIGYMSGTYSRLTQQMSSGALSSKPLALGGSCLRVESTGYGIAKITKMILSELKQVSLDGLDVAISGAGNVALHCAEQLTRYGANVVTLSDSKGVLYCEKGFSEEDLRILKSEKFGSHGKKRLADLRDVLETTGVEYREGGTAWNFPCAVAIPCATERELNAADLKRMRSLCQERDQKFLAVMVGSNMGMTEDALTEIRKLVDRKELIFAPDKMCNLAGVAVSYLEMAQNAQRGVRWKSDEVAETTEDVLKKMLNSVLERAKAQENNWDLWRACHACAFDRIRTALLEQGHVWETEKEEDPEASQEQSECSEMSERGK